MNKTNNGSKANLVILGLVVLIILEFMAAWMTVGVYAQRSDSSIVRRTAGFLPIAKVGSYSVSYNQFLTARDAIKTFLNSPAVKAAGQSQPLTPVIEKSAYERLLREAATKELATQRNVAVSNDDVNKAYDDFLNQASSTVKDVPKYLKDTFNWTPDQYRVNVIRPQILEEKVTLTFAASSGTDQGTQFENWVAERLQKPDVKRYLNFPGTN
jgi:hypothetical protein